MNPSDDDAPPDTGMDSGMASGTDAGTPGEHLGTAELDPDEQRLLDQLQRDVGHAPAGAPEDSIAALRAAEDEGPLPAHGGAQDDGLDVVFDAPGER